MLLFQNCFLSQSIRLKWILNQIICYELISTRQSILQQIIQPARESVNSRLQTNLLHMTTLIIAKKISHPSHLMMRITPNLSLSWYLLLMKRRRNIDNKIRFLLYTIISFFGIQYTYAYLSIDSIVLLCSWYSSSITYHFHTWLIYIAISMSRLISFSKLNSFVPIANYANRLFHQQN